MTEYSSEAVSDYLDRPPQRWKLADRPVMDCHGDWVRFTDMDLYMFEGGQLMQRMLAENEQKADEIKRLKEINTALVRDFNTLLADNAKKSESLKSWLEANSPGGWIDKLRERCGDTCATDTPA